MSHGQPMTGSEDPQFTIRTATAADLGVVTGLLQDAGLPLDGIEDAWLVLLAEVPEPQDGDAQTVGVIALECHGQGEATALLLRSAAVSERWRSHGIGTQLVNLALEAADAQHAPTGLLTEGAAAYFQRFGFRLTSWDELPASLGASTQLQGTCPTTADALVRPV